MTAGELAVWLLVALLGTVVACLVALVVAATAAEVRKLWRQ